MKIGKIFGLVLGSGLVSFLILSSVRSTSEYEYGKLTFIADKYRTDKGSIGGAWPAQNYTEVYEYFLLPIKNSARKICEIGVYAGASLYMFRDYFPNAVIYGIDILDTSRLNSDKIKTFIADQSNRTQLKEFIKTHGGEFDLILDDGGHSMNQQQISFGYLFKYLKSGGYYIIEDVQSSILSVFGPGFGVEANAENTTLAMINNYVKNTAIKSKYLTPEEENYLTENIKYCNLLIINNKHKFGNSISCIIQKR